MFLMLLLCSVLAYILSVLWSRRKLYRLHEKLKNESWCLPVLGNILDLIGDNEVVSDPDIAEIVLKTCLAKGNALKVTSELIGNGSIFAPVHVWRPRRKVMAPIFSTKNLNQFVEVFNKQGNILVEQLRPAAGTGVFSLWKYMTSYTMDSVYESTLGVTINAQQQLSHPFPKAFEEICMQQAHRLLLPRVLQILCTYLPYYKQISKSMQYVWNFVDKIIEKKQQEMMAKDEKIQQHEINATNEDQPRLKTFLELMMESSGGSSGFTNVELREETLVLTLAGTDTSAVGSCFTCLMLARHPEVQDKVYEELKAELGETDASITAADLPKLKYLEAVVKESLRLYPPVPVIVRDTTEDFLLPSGVTIVKDTQMLISIWAVHRNPGYWGEDAEQFRPERFLSYSPAHPAQFIPFSHGPRACLGYKYAMMSMKTALAKLVRHYRILPASPVRDRNEPLRVKQEIMMKHVDNFKLQLQPRKTPLHPHMVFTT